MKDLDLLRWHLVLTGNEFRHEQGTIDSLPEGHNVGHILSTSPLDVHCSTSLRISFLDLIHSNICDSSGVIKLNTSASSRNWSSIEYFNLTVIASLDDGLDSPEPATVIITLFNSRATVPVFTRQLFNFNIKEGLPPGEPVDKVTTQLSTNGLLSLLYFY